MMTRLLKVKKRTSQLRHQLTPVFKSRRLYSSTALQETENLVEPSSNEELLLPLVIATPMITKNELENYFYPLFCRGWNIKRLSEADVEHLRDHVRNI